VFAVASPGRAPDTPGWQVRVVPNLYPAFEHQEVIVHSPRHVRTLADLADDELSPIATAWHERLSAARDAGFGYPFLLLNQGREAGASLPHSHSQIVWLEEAPPEAAREVPQLAAGACGLCKLLADDALEIAVDGDLSLHAAPAGRAPYEVLIAPRAHEAEPGVEALASAVRLLRLTFSRVRAQEGPTPVNAWLHHGEHWHFEVVPRLPTLAGLELGGGIYVNWLAPEEAVIRLRS
jgi:UDPglucose--hexose-1-phosphate uridylyltransferase